MKFKNIEVSESLDESVVIKEGVEDFLAQEAELRVDGEDTDEVYDALDDALRASLSNMKRKNGRPSNLFIWGDPGSGKTSKVNSWAVGYRGGRPINYTGQRLNLVTMKGPDFDEVITRGAVAKNPDDPYTLIRLTTTEFDKLNKPGTVLYVDECNRTSPKAIDALLKLVDEKIVADSREDSNLRHLDNLIFTVFSANFEDSERGQDATARKLSAAMINRGGHITTANSPRAWLSWYAHDLGADFEEMKDNPEYTPEELEQEKAASEGRFAIAKTLVDAGIKFDDRETVAYNTDEQKPSVNSRSLTFLLDNCDGTKADFIKKWPRFCNASLQNEVKSALADYQDDPNLKGNKALQFDSHSSFLAANRNAEDNALTKMKKYKKNNAID